MFLEWEPETRRSWSNKGGQKEQDQRTELNSADNGDAAILRKLVLHDWNHIVGRLPWEQCGYKNGDTAMTGSQRRMRQAV